MTQRTPPWPHAGASASLARARSLTGQVALAFRSAAELSTGKCGRCRKAPQRTVPRASFAPLAPRPTPQDAGSVPTLAPNLLPLYRRRNPRARRLCSFQATIARTRSVRLAPPPSCPLSSCRCRQDLARCVPAMPRAGHADSLLASVAWACPARCAALGNAPPIWHGVPWLWHSPRGYRPSSGNSEPPKAWRNAGASPSVHEGRIGRCWYRVGDARQGIEARLLSHGKVTRTVMQRLPWRALFSEGSPTKKG